MLAAASILVLDATAQATVRGLRKAEWAAYAVAEDGSFQCRDGSATKARLNGAPRLNPPTTCTGPASTAGSLWQMTTATVLTAQTSQVGRTRPGPSHRDAPGARLLSAAPTHPVRACSWCRHIRVPQQPLLLR